MKQLIKDLAHCERPYEKALEYGIESLSDSELLAVVLRSGTKDVSSISLANSILNAHIVHKGIYGLKHLRRDDLLKIKGIGDIKATQIMAITELAVRLNQTVKKQNICFDNPKSIAEYYIDKCKYASKEQSYLMLFSNSCMLIKEILLSEGTIRLSLMSPREIYIEALKYEAVHIVLIHNHPSGNPEPSEADINTTLRIKEAGQLMDIELADHIIVGSDSYVSLLERGIL